MIPKAELRRATLEARDQILEELQRESLTQFSRYRLNETLRAIEDAIAELVEKYDGIFRKAIEGTFVDAVGASVRSVLKRSADVIDEAKEKAVARAFTPTIPRSRILSLSEYRFDLARDVGEETFQAMRASMQVGVLKNESLAELAQRIVGTSKTGPRSVLQMTNTHAVLIADTETHRADMAGRYHATNEQERAMSQYFELWRLWKHSAVTELSRPGHVAAGLRHPAIRSTGVFMVASKLKGKNSTPEAMRYPGDARGSAANTVRCHCVTIERLFPRGVTAEAAEKALRSGR